MNTDENDLRFNETLVESESKQRSVYTSRYRVLKTILLLLTWISMSFNKEIISPALEDLRILLSINYQQVTYMFIVRVIGSMIATASIGLVLDRLLNHSDIMIAVFKLIFAIRKK